MTDATSSRDPRHVVALRSIVASTVVSVGLSLVVTGAMSWLFHGEIRADMMATGFVAGAVVNLIVVRIVKRYRRRLHEANEALERRVAERTAELERTNEELRNEMGRRSSLQQQLMVVERMATAGELAAGICHEIRNPLAAITANLGCVRDAVCNDEGAREAVDDIADAVDRVHRLSTDLTTLSRPPDDPVGPVELAPVVASAARLAAHEIRRGRLEVSITDEVVLANPSRLCQVFLNLLINAAKATRDDAPNRIHVRAATEDDEVVVTISDTGTGIAPHDLEHVFEPYFTTRADTGGTGLGMPVVRSIVEALGGHVTIDSTLGAGTDVTMRLRRA